MKLNIKYKIGFKFQSLVAGVKSHQIGIITPYSKQREGLTANLQAKYPELEINSVDGFQGREKEAIIWSMVRSNEQGNLGFLRYLERECI